MATLAVAVAFLLFGVVGALLDLKHAGGLVVQIPFYMLVVALWGYVYNSFKPACPSTNEEIINPTVDPPINNSSKDIDKYVHLSGILNIVLAALLLVAILKLIDLRRQLHHEERVDGVYTFYDTTGRRGTVKSIDVYQALHHGGILVEQSRRDYYEKFHLNK